MRPVGGNVVDVNLRRGGPDGVPLAWVVGCRIGVGSLFVGPAKVGHDGVHRGGVVALLERVFLRCVLDQLGQHADVSIPEWVIRRGYSCRSPTPQAGSSRGCTPVRVRAGPHRAQFSRTARCTSHESREQKSKVPSSRDGEGTTAGGPSPWKQRGWTTSSWAPRKHAGHVYEALHPSKP